MASRTHTTATIQERGTSPTCVCQFADDETTRLTVWAKTGQPDIKRGIKLSIQAYNSRTGNPAPEIAELHFERDGEVVLVCTPEQIVKATP